MAKGKNKMTTLAVILFSSIFLLFFIILVFAAIKFITTLDRSTKIKTGMEQARDMQNYINEAAEKVIRIEQMKKDEEEKDNPGMIFWQDTEAMLTDVMREAGIDVNAFNVEALLKAKYHEMKTEEKL